MVGVGGGVPSTKHDIRLGDVVVSLPIDKYGGVVQYDKGKSTPTGFDHTGFLDAPPVVLRSAIQILRANEHTEGNRLSKHLATLNNIPKFSRDTMGPDILFQASNDHRKGEETCNMCDHDKILSREPRTNDEIKVHYGIIASGNQVMRSGIERDRVSSQFGGVLCFEMEAAGLMNNFPCIVIRGICDYSDSHKNKSAQPHAASTAAAFAKELLSIIPSKFTNSLSVTETGETSPAF
jgi:nucleoside phosphorylase